MDMCNRIHTGRLDDGCQLHLKKILLVSNYIHKYNRQVFGYCSIYKEFKYMLYLGYICESLL